MATLQEIYQKYQGQGYDGSDKGTWHSYIDVYESLLSGFVSKGAVLLELGVATGKSLLMWREYLVDGTIHGVDLLTMPVCLDGVPSVFFHWMDLNDKFSMEKEFAGMEFDIIIDDASHEVGQQVLDASILAPKLKDGGIYIVEDVSDLSSVSLFASFGKVELMDRRSVKGRFDDSLIIIRKA